MKKDFYNHKHTKGFNSSMTIVEIIMVTVILGLLIVLVTPRFQAYHVLKLQTAAKKIINDIQYVQNLAISRHDDYLISFNPAANSYTATVLSTGEKVKDPLTHLDLTVVLDNESSYRGVDIISVDFNSTNSLRFDWQGIPYDQDGVELSDEGIIILSYYNEQIKISVTPYTGRVAWQLL